MSAGPANLNAVISGALTILRHYPEKHELLWAAKVDRSEMRWLGLDPFENKDPGDEKMRMQYDGT